MISTRSILTIFASAQLTLGTNILDDDFNDGSLATNPDTGGGFALQTNGVGASANATEVNSQAQIQDGDGNNTAGILSIDRFDLSNNELSHAITWDVASWTPGNAGALRRIFLTLQTNNSWLFAGDQEESRIIVVIDLGNNDAFFRYQNRSGGANTNFDSPRFNLGTLSADPDGFQVTLELDPNGFTLESNGLNATNQIALSGSWDDLGTNFNAALGTDGSMHVGAYVQDSGTSGSPFHLGRIAIDSAPFTSPRPSIQSFTAESRSVNPGEMVELSWMASSFDSLVLNPGAIDAAALTQDGTGSLTVTVNEATTYTLTAGVGTESDQKQVTVNLKRTTASPNVLIFLVDDMGVTDTSVPFAYDSQGNAIQTNFNDFYVTPNMETLAANGMKFTQAYATPACSPTRASLMTGFNTLRHGVCLQVNPNGVLAPNPVAPLTTSHSTPNDWKSRGLTQTDATSSLPSLLSSSGYRTIHCGKGHFGSTGSFGADPLNIGFDINFGGSRRGAPQSYTGNYGGDLPNMEPWENTGTFLTDALSQALNGAIEDAVNDEVPFLAYMSHYAVHTPFTRDPNATGDYSSGVNSNHRTFATMIEGMDRSLGDVLTKLDQLGIAENTLVIFLGDNGSDSPAATQNGLASGNFHDFPLRGKKATGWEGGVRVPMLVSWAKPDATNPLQQALPIEAQSRQDDIVTVWDIFPTVMDITGTALPQEVDGHSLAPYLRGEPGSHRPQEMLLYWPNDHNNDYFALYREENWKLIYRFATDSFELYDLASDPSESADLAANNPQRVMSMARAMAREFENGWGTTGTLWPTFSQEGNRPYPDDPFLAPELPAIDTDQDGITDNDEDANRNGLVDPGETNPDQKDSDGDQTPDGTEQELGTDPLDSTSYFYLRATPLPNGTMNLTWPSRPGTTFQIRASADLQDWSNILEANLPASESGSVTNYPLPASSSDRMFYRVGLN